MKKVAYTAKGVYLTLLHCNAELPIVGWGRGGMGRPGSEFIKKVELRKVLPNSVE
jgi:hypothetical protein